MNDDDYRTLKEMHIDYISVAPVPISFNAFVVELLNGCIADMDARANKKVEALLKA
jgi:hypothetical protein